MANWTPVEVEADAALCATRPRLSSGLTRVLRIRLMRLARIGRQLRNERISK